MIEIYEEKTNMDTKPELPVTSKVTDNDMNQLREAVIQGVYQSTCTDKELEQAVSSSSDTDLTALKDKDGAIIDANIPRYEKFKQDASSFFKFEDMQKSVMIAANGQAGVDIGEYHAPEGYDILGVIPLSNGVGDVWQVTYSQYGGKHIYAYIKSYFNGNLTSTVRCRVIYVSLEYYNQNLIIKEEE